MVGAAFNPRGLTSEDLKQKDALIMAKFEAMDAKELSEYWDSLQETLKWWSCSHDREWILFERYFVDREKQLIKKRATNTQ